ncbi:MAG: prohibitin family protein [Halobacteriovoraceae bacterium]|nr:prohibitin family protein [Halobacteriovoraceae bacterium]
MYQNGQVDNKKAIFYGIVVSLFLFVFIILFSSWTVVDAGYRGVKIRLGEVQEVLDEGLHFIPPLITKVVKIPVREAKFQNKVSAYSKDAQIVEATFAINIYPQKSDIALLYQDVGPDFIEKLSPQIIEATIKEVFGQYKAVDLIINRQEAAQRIREVLTPRLKEKRLNLTNFDVVNLDFDDAFEKAVKEKVIAVELSKRSENLLEKAKNDKAIRITEAQAEAEAMRIKANALKSNKNLTQYEAILKWDGKLPTYMMGNSVPFINFSN